MDFTPKDSLEIHLKFTTTHLQRLAASECCATYWYFGAKMAEEKKMEKSRPEFSRI